MVNLSSMKVAELKAACTERGLNITGLKLKADYISVLEKAMKEEEAAAAAPAAAPAVSEPVAATPAAPEVADTPEPSVEAAPEPIAEVVPEPEVQEAPVVAEVVETPVDIAAATEAPASAASDKVSPIEVEMKTVEESEVGEDKTELQAVDEVPAADEKIAEESVAEKAEEAPKEEEKVEEPEPEEEDTEPQEWEYVEMPKEYLPSPCYKISCLPEECTEEEVTELLKDLGVVLDVTLDGKIGFVRISPLEGSSAEDLAQKLKEATSGDERIELKESKVHIEAYKADSLIYVGNTAEETDDAQLKEMFTEFGRIVRCFVMKNKDGVSKGYGFIEFALRAQALKARSNMGGKPNKEGEGARTLRVDFAECPENKSYFSSTVFVDQLPKGFKDAKALEEHFKPHGKTTNVHIVMQQGGVPKGFAFIDFKRSDCADAARRALDGSEFEGSTIRVQFSNPARATEQKQRGESKGGNRGEKG
eukprot:CAMPEP_0197850680 /NCGR_PEP_ID=MMETSP1438-20131217/16080_1 /TAXON_ID=1461541 /ORGANISM="Pterosperma sp., Strain CCMP1384" /LENGTH=476 /DNA_ID=CAMNT_0043463971 /DNA_START=128 /DNA_END=1554 /DNA_ORIENTATION=-